MKVGARQGLRKKFDERRDPRSFGVRRGDEQVGMGKKNVVVVQKKSVRLSWLGQNTKGGRTKTEQDNVLFCSKVAARYWSTGIR